MKRTAALIVGLLSCWLSGAEAQPGSSPRSVQIQVSSDRAGLTLLREVASGYGVSGWGISRSWTFEPVCVAPCTANVPSYSFITTVRTARGGLVSVRPPAYIDRSMTLHLNYRSRKATRRALYFTGLLLTIAGSGLYFLGANVDQDGYRELSSEGVISGSITVSAGLIMLMTAPFLADRAELRPIY